jgi:hypothetical protein
MAGVVIATPYPDHVSGQFLNSLVRVIQYDAETQRHLVPGTGGILGMSTGPRIAEARSMMVDSFANEPDYANAEWLLQIDSDMVFGEDLVERMMAAANPDTVPILGALCFAGGRGGKPFPTIYEESEGADGFVNLRPVDDFPRDALMRVGATGTGCLLVHRSVFGAMKRPHPDGWGTLPNGATNPYPWFQEGLTGPHGEPFGEDIVFCRRARAMGIPIHVHTGIEVGHHKSFVLGRAHWEAARAAALADTSNAGRVVGDVAALTPNRAERRRRAREAMAAAG